MTYSKISKLLAARQQAFLDYNQAREMAFSAANYRDETKTALKGADQAIQNYLRESLPS